MTLLVISPDYASHLLPLATLAAPWREAGESVVVATGPATEGIVAGFGFQRVDLVLGRGSNPGVIRAEQQPPGEDAALRGFFDATAWWRRFATRPRHDVPTCCGTRWVGPGPSWTSSTGCSPTR